MEELQMGERRAEAMLRLSPNVQERGAGAAAGVTSTGQRPLENTAEQINSLAYKREPPLPHLSFGMSSVNAFGSSYLQGQTTKLEGPWVAPIYTALILFSFSYYTYASKTGPKSSLMKALLVYYPFATAIVEVCRVIFDANRFSFVWAALHNLGEWGLIIHMLVGKDKARFAFLPSAKHFGVFLHTVSFAVSSTWPFAMLWILFISNLVLFLPNFVGAALSEQVTGIWCDWLLITCFSLRCYETKGNPALRKLFLTGVSAAVMHMAEILPLVALLTGYVKSPSLGTSFVISFTSPITFYLYSQFALQWEAATNASSATPVGASAPSGGALGSSYVDGFMSANEDDAAPVRSTPKRKALKTAPTNGASTPGPYLAQTRHPKTLAIIMGGCFILGLGTVVVPRFAAPACAPDPLSPLPALPMVEPMCLSSSYVAGTTKVVAKPGQADALMDMLLSTPAETRLEEGNLSYDINFEPPSTFHIADSWTSLRTLNKRLSMSPVDARTFYSPQFHAMVANASVEGPFHPLVPCSLAATQPKLQSMSFEVELDAPLACVWKNLDDFSVTGYIAEQTSPSKLITPGLRQLNFPPYLHNSNCTVYEARQRYPVVPKNTLRYHTVSGCWTEASVGGDVEVNIDTLSVAPGTLPSRSKLTLQLEIMAKSQGRSVAVYEIFSQAGAARLPFVKNFFETACKK